MKYAIIVASFLTSVMVSTCFASEMELGKQLFADKRLGTTGKSCASCHPGGKKLEGVTKYTESQLAEIVNSCIEKALQGKPLALKSAKIQALVRYIKTFGKASAP